MGKLVRLWKNTKTGRFVNHKVDDDCVSTNLVYDSKTRIMYYKFSEIVTVDSITFADQKPFDTKVGYMSPYITENGKMCKFTVRMEFVEIG